MTAPACGTCRFAVLVVVSYGPGTLHAEGEQPALECHRYPPTVIPMTEGDETTAGHTHPTVSDNDWCGEYRPDSGRRSWLEQAPPPPSSQSGR